jgi:hypothetical protein
MECNKHGIGPNKTWAVIVIVFSHRQNSLFLVGLVGKQAWVGCENGVVAWTQ